MDIDFVVTWVDGSDAAWLQEKARYAPGSGEDARAIRFRDWDNLRYWFRGVEIFAPWVRRVHIITWGHLPPWLDADNPRLHVVNHRDFIPAEYLPTFSSRPIELNMHRIEGLADRFVYFNDDMFLTRAVAPTDFFRKGLPVDACSFGVPHARSLNGTFAHALLNNAAVLNRHLNKGACRKRALGKWLNPRNGRDNVFKTLCLLPWPYFTGFSYHHLAVAYERKTFEALWAAEPAGLDATCRRRFRSMADINHLAVRDWRLARGEFAPGRVSGRAFFFLGGQTPAAAAAKAIRAQAYKMVCLNDDAGKFDFGAEKERLQAAFEAILPRKCSFER